MKDLLGVLGAVAVLGGVLAAVAADATGLARCEQHHLGVQLELDNVARALEDHRLETGAYPAALAELDARFEAGSVPLDYWRRPFVYARSGDGFTLMSLGRDGRPGGRGEDADVPYGRPIPPSSASTKSGLVKPAGG